MQLLRKISRATMVGDNTAVMELCLAEKDKTHLLYRIWGFANGIRKSSEMIDPKTGENKSEKFGPWQSLIGQFQGLNLRTGEISQSGVVFLPQYAIDIVAGQFGGDTERVKFAFEVGAKFDDTTPTKYNYTVASLIEPAENDEMAEFAKSLPGPRKAAQIADQSKDKGKSK